MPHGHSPDDWNLCVLCRSQQQSIATFHRAAQRKVEWPEPKPYSENPIKEPLAYTSIDDAFGHILQYLSSTTKYCKRYYGTCEESSKQPNDKVHCARFHDSAQYTKALHNNPLQTSEDIHLMVNPGSYAITTGEWGSTQQQTHVVKVEPGQSVNLDFVL